MNITEVRLKIMPRDVSKCQRLVAFCTIVIDHGFVIHDLKIIAGEQGLFVAMPSRKRTTHCAKCGASIAVIANFCGHCGSENHAKETPTPEGRQKFFSDIAHPTKNDVREYVDRTVLLAYRQKLCRIAELGYDPDPYDYQGEDAA